MAAIKVLVLTTMMVASTIASVYDCWDPEKLTRMNFPVSHQEANDPNLGKFSKLLKCVMQQQSKQPGGLSNMDWGQIQNVASEGRFPNGWNNQPGWQRPGFSSNSNNWNSNMGGGINNQGNQGNSGQQPRPGVHPDDWNNNNIPGPAGPPVGGPGGNWPPPRPPSPPPPNQPPPGWNPQSQQNEVENRKKNKNRRKNQQNQLDLQEPNILMPSPNPSLNPVAFDGPTGTQWGGGNMGAINDEESRKESRNRQYGYAIMACAVVALAVLMVSAIFCCNSSNSTMSQPATQVTVQPPDTFSIYSYTKQPVTDTLRSGPLADTMLRGPGGEATMRGPSPQYRVSDIDPEFARRFREEHY